VRVTDEIATLTQQRVQRYIDLRTDPDLYKSLRNMSEFVSDDYGNRFLTELIQNAHDAHDSTRCNGEIDVVLVRNQAARQVKSLKTKVPLQGGFQSKRCLVAMGGLEPPTPAL
jgi:hypothetical protein